MRLPPLLASTAPSSSSSTEGPSYFEWLGRQVELKLRPKPYVDGIRLQVDKDLAVLLMRSSYSISDDLDFIPMDQFQKEFFFVRQAEWEGGWGGLGSRSLRVVWLVRLDCHLTSLQHLHTHIHTTPHPTTQHADYLYAYPPLTVKQGFLTDPAYLDFISFAQYATINQEMRRGKLVFVEQVSNKQASDPDTQQSRTTADGMGWVPIEPLPAIHDTSIPHSTPDQCRGGEAGGEA